MIPVLGIICGNHIKSVRELDLIEYEEYKQAVERLGNFMKDQELMVMVRRDYDEYENLLQPYAVEYLKGDAPRLLPFDRLSLEINTRILNFLSSVRTFLDHTETYLKRRYGENSERFNKFKQACSDAYDNNFSYKFIYHLRNYAQHCGMPTSQMRFNKIIVDREAQKIGTSIQILCNRDELLIKHNWKKVKAELQQQPEEIEIGHHMYEMLNCLHQINLILIEQEFPNIIESAQTIEQLVLPLRNEMESSQCTPIIFQRVEKHTTGVNLTLESIPLEWLDLFKDLY
jgi:hypothetical protein